MFSLFLSRTDNDIEQLQTNEERMFLAHAGGKKGRPIQNGHQECRKQGMFSHLSVNHLQLKWLFQPHSKAKPDQSQGEQGAEEEEHGGYFFTAEQEKADKAHQAGEKR